MVKEVIPLYIADSISVLEAVVQKDDTIKNLKKTHRFSNLAIKIKGQLQLCQEDQEKCYILGRRYINLMDHLFKISDDQNYSRSLFITDYQNVKDLVTSLRVDLDKRYRALFEKFHESHEIIPPPPPSSTSTDNKEYIGPDYVKKTEDFANPLFPGTFIVPLDLYNMIMMQKNILLVDIRSPEQFISSKVNLVAGNIINIPQELIVPGLSANTLGQRLPEEVQKIWDHRDIYDVIVLMDYDTEKYNYNGSTLERLRSFIVEWDFNRKYRQAPVVLSGGLREFVEWYPTEVDNSHVFLSQTNSEIDELLILDSITYPETGTGGQMNLKVHSINSVGNVESRVERDFGDIDEILGLVPARPSRSEGNLPKDSYIVRDQELISPYRTLSEESLPKDFVETAVDPIEAQDIYKLTEDFEALKIAEDEKAKLKSILEGDRASLLHKARATKPKSFPEGPVLPDTEQRKENEPVEKPSEKSITSKDKQVGFFVPTVDRTFKPAIPIKPPPLPSIAAPYVTTPGEGYTGLKNYKNICYMNCMLQCLKVLPLIKATYVTSNRYMQHNRKFPPNLNMIMSLVFKSLWEGTENRPKLYYPHLFKDKVVSLSPIYDKGNHEDTFEFFMFIFNVISEDCSFDLPRPMIMTESEKAWYAHLQGRTSFLVDTFYYQLKNTKVCWNCRQPNLSFETDSSLMLSVPNRMCNLRELINEYLKENLVPEYSCSDCKCSATIVNMKEIVVDPEVLVIVLKRYIANEDGTFRKNEVDIGFPLKNLKFGKSFYNLYAVVQHNGSMTHGHYFASVLLDDVKDHWVLFNDEKVTKYEYPINEAAGVRTSCAGFFYVREK